VCNVINNNNKYTLHLGTASFPVLRLRTGTISVPKI